MHAARIVSGQYPDGVFYLNFHSHDPGSPSLDAAEALHRLLQMLTVPATQIPESLSERATLWRAQLSRRRAVVILDDTASVDQVGPLLPSGGRSLVLVTSRYRIPGLAEAQALTLDALPVDDAVTLFRRIAGADAAHDDAEVAAVVELCGRLPLAIQLTAGRLARGYPSQLGDLVAELSRPPTLIGEVGASLEWVPAFGLSYRALEPRHQQFFRRLGLSPATQISPHAAAALGGVCLAEAEEAIGVLLDHHLLSRAPGGQFVFHDLIRGYAAMCAERDEQASVRRQSIGRLLDYYLHTADRADRELYPFRRRMAVSVTQPPASPALATREGAAAWLEAEWRNVLHAAQYAARHEWKRRCADLVRALVGYMDIRAYWDEASRRTPWPCRQRATSRTGARSRRRCWISARWASRRACTRQCCPWRKMPLRSTGPRPTGAVRRMPSTRWAWLTCARAVTVRHLPTSTRRGFCTVPPGTNTAWPIR